MFRSHYRFCLTVIGAVVFMSAYTARAQHSAALKAHVFQSIHRLYTISYEQAFNNHISAELALQGGHYVDIRPNRFEDFEVTGIGAIGAVRYYPFTKKIAAPGGFFGYLAIRYITFSEKFTFTASGDDFKVRGSMFNAGGGIGYKYVYRRVGIEGYIGWGAGRRTTNDDDARKNFPPYYRGTMDDQNAFPQLDLAVCYMLRGVGEK